MIEYEDGDGVGAVGARPADRAGHEPSQSALSRPAGDHPSRDELRPSGCAFWGGSGTAMCRSFPCVHPRCEGANMNTPHTETYTILRRTSPRLIVEKPEMKATEFCYWLQGMFELANPRQLDEEQTELVRRHLAMAFQHDIDQRPNEAEQAKLNKLHSGPTAGATMRC